MLGAPEFIMKDRYEDISEEIEEYQSKGYRVLLMAKSGDDSSGLEKSFGGISPIGYIYPCAYCVDNPKYLIGDITNGIDQNAVKRIHDLPPTYNMKCLECSKADGCVVTRCTLVNEVMTGNPYENNNLCNIERCLI